MPTNGSRIDHPVRRIAAPLATTAGLFDAPLRDMAGLFAALSDKKGAAAPAA